MVRTRPKRCLILSVSGIGNTILQSALIEKILASARYKVDCLFGSSAMATVFKGDRRINRSFILPKGLLQTWSLCGQLLASRYDTTIACFPSNRPQFHLLPFLILARQRIIHDYGRWNCNLSFLSNVKVKAQEGLHDVKQNLNLLHALKDIECSDGPIRLTFRLSHEDEKQAERFIKALRIDTNDQILGIHPGAGPLKGKEWGVERFAEVANTLLAEKVFTKVLIFGGPEERDTKERLFQLIGNELARVVDAPLSTSAALIKRCTFFLSNDTGLMHIAAACGVRVLGIFGPTSWVRTAPFGENAFFIRPNTQKIPCAPCLKYPFKAQKPSFGCTEDFPCLESISSELVVDAIHSLLNHEYKELAQKTHTGRIHRMDLDLFDASPV